MASGSGFLSSSVYWRENSSGRDTDAAMVAGPSSRHPRIWSERWHLLRLERYWKRDDFRCRRFGASRRFRLTHLERYWKRDEFGCQRLGGSWRLGLRRNELRWYRAGLESALVSLRFVVTSMFGFFRGRCRRLGGSWPWGLHWNELRGRHQIRLGLLCLRGTFGPISRRFVVGPLATVHDEERRLAIC